MSDPAVTTVWARAFMDELARMGVRHVCVAPGSRSTPLVMALANDGRFTTWVHLDERSAGFFALGIGKVTKRPAAVITTSGTATANLLPSVIESSLGGVPLLVLTTDRPLRLRGSDANQTIDQEGLYGSYPRASLDAGDPAEERLVDARKLACRAAALTLGPEPGPVHVNLPFDKPLDPVELDAGRMATLRAVDPLGLDGRSDGTPIESSPRVEGVDAATGASTKFDGLIDFLRDGKRGLIVAGPVSDAERVGPALVRLSKSTGFPLLADPLSGARFVEGAGPTSIAAYDLFLREPAVRDLLRPDHILRVGRPPTSAGLLSFLEACRGVPQVVITDGGHQSNSLADVSTHMACDVAEAIQGINDSFQEPVAVDDWREAWERVDQSARHAVSETAGDFFEGDILRTLVDCLPADATLFVSNSMPVRDLDAFGGAGPKQLRVFGNRGASGIDGIVSTAAGIAAARPPKGEETDAEPVVAVVGDLAFYHDMNGLLAVAREKLNVLYLVINNDGGGIFHMLPIREHEPEFTRYFATPHGLDFGRAAELYGISYILLDASETLAQTLQTVVLEPGPRILEIRTDRDSNHRRHVELVDAVADATRREVGG
jgi:2-succinyl-5-enolpyruvyl-6-hydroxy-3-cyclohexene-1-carboxylate synthase